MGLKDANGEELPEAVPTEVLQMGHRAVDDVGEVVVEEGALEGSGVDCDGEKNEGSPEAGLDQSAVAALRGECGRTVLRRMCLAHRGFAFTIPDSIDG